MYACERIMEHMARQIELAPQLIENDSPGGNFCPKHVGDLVETVVDKLKEGMNRAEHIPVLRGVESGFRRYSTEFAKALPHAEAVAAIFTKLQATRGQMFQSPEHRELALRPFAGKSQEIVTHCRAISECMERALGILEEGEIKDAKTGEKLGPVHVAKGEEPPVVKKQRPPKAPEPVAAE